MDSLTLSLSLLFSLPPLPVDPDEEERLISLVQQRRRFDEFLHEICFTSLSEYASTSLADLFLLTHALGTCTSCRS